MKGEMKDLSVMAVRVGVANFFLGQSIGIDDAKSQFSSFCSFRYLSIHTDGRTDGHG